MLKRSVQYIDFDGVSCTEDLYFNLTQSEIVEWEAEFNGGLAKHLTNVMQAGDGQVIMNTFRMLIKRTYGIKSSDGKRFIKSPQIAEEFAQTAAYDAFFMSLMSGGAKSAAEFIMAVVPSELSSQLPSPDEALQQAQKLLEAGAIVEPEQITLYNETPVTDENVPPLQPYVAPEGSFSALAQARLAQGPLDHEPSQYDLQNMTKEQLLELLTHQKTVGGE